MPAPACSPRRFPTIFRQNDKIITHAGRKPPYGYVDWWPISLYVNNEVKPFDDRDVRWALSYYIDRTQLIDVAYSGASQTSSLPLPAYKPLQPYFDVVKDLLAKHDTLEVNPKKGDALLTGKGYKKDSGRLLGRRRRRSTSSSRSSASAPAAPAWGRCCRRC